MHKKEFLVQLVTTGLYTLLVVFVLIVSYLPIVFGVDLFLPVRAVDPVDPLRGRYLRLEYEISWIDQDLARSDITLYDAVYVYLDYNTKPIKVSRNLDECCSDFAYVLRGGVVNLRSGRIKIEYGIEAYFVSPRLANKLEEQRDKFSLVAHIKVDKTDNSRIVRLIDQHSS